MTAEQNIQNAVLVWLQKHKIFAWRANTGGAMMRGRWVDFNIKGCADVIAVLPPDGRFCAIEIKSARGVQSEFQKKFEERVRACGGIYILAKSTEGVYASLVANGWRGEG